MIIDGQKLAFKKQSQLKKEINRLKKINQKTPLLITFVAQEDKEGLLYTKLKKETALKLGINFKKILFSFKKKEEIYLLLNKVLKKEEFAGLLIQKPNKQLIKQYFKSKKEFKRWWLKASLKIPKKKDVDCLTIANLGLLVSGLPYFYPATVKAIFHLLRFIYKREEKLAGKEIVVIGSSEILGKPLALLLRDKGATVCLCGSSCQDLKSTVREKEIVISAVGQPKLITAEMVKKGAVVIDAGISSVGKEVVGDVDFSKVAPITSFITPVPDGVGPLTVISLMENLVQAFKESGKKENK